MNLVEYCVTCGNKTLFHWFDDINERAFYVQGVGQLCVKCGKKHYDVK